MKRPQQRLPGIFKSCITLENNSCRTLDTLLAAASCPDRHTSGTLGVRGDPGRRAFPMHRKSAPAMSQEHWSARPESCPATSSPWVHRVGRCCGIRAGIGFEGSSSRVAATGALRQMKAAKIRLPERPRRNLRCLSIAPANGGENRSMPGFYCARMLQNHGEIRHRSERI